jgi:hypothetical protein
MYNGEEFARTDVVSAMRPGWRAAEDNGAAARPEL